MGDESRESAGIRILQGPKRQVRSLGSLLQTKGSLRPQDWSSASGSEAGSLGRMGGGGNSIQGRAWLGQAESGGESWAVRGCAAHTSSLVADCLHA